MILFGLQINLICQLFYLNDHLICLLLYFFRFDLLFHYIHLNGIMLLLFRFCRFHIRFHLHSHFHFCHLPFHFHFCDLYFHFHFFYLLSDSNVLPVKIISNKSLSKFNNFLCPVVCFLYFIISTFFISFSAFKVDFAN